MFFLSWVLDFVGYVLGLFSILLCLCLRQLKESLETFEASINTPYVQIHCIDRHMLSWNPSKFPIASSKVPSNRATSSLRQSRLGKQWWIWSLDEMKGDMYSKILSVEWQAFWEWYVKWQIKGLGHLSFDMLRRASDMLSNGLWQVQILTSDEIISIGKKIHEEHNDTYCDLPSTFFLDEFAFKTIRRPKTGLS